MTEKSKEDDTVRRLRRSNRRKTQLGKRGRGHKKKKSQEEDIEGRPMKKKSQEEDAVRKKI